MPYSHYSSFIAILASLALSFMSCAPSSDIESGAEKTAQTQATTSTPGTAPPSGGTGSTTPAPTPGPMNPPNAPKRIVVVATSTPQTFAGCPGTLDGTNLNPNPNIQVRLNGATLTQTPAIAFTPSSAGLSSVTYVLTTTGFQCNQQNFVELLQLPYSGPNQQCPVQYHYELQDAQGQTVPFGSTQVSSPWVNFISPGSILWPFEYTYNCI